MADFGVSATILDSERVQIWPVAQGAFSGYDPTEAYETMPPVTITLDDLYPFSTTYLRVYPGEQTADPQGAANVSESFVVIDDSIPQDRRLILKDLDRYFVEHGPYTMELLHVTPFGIDLIHSAAVLIDRKIEFTGSLNTADRE